jgi:hypothetical protein
MIHVALVAFALAAPVPKVEGANSKGTLAVLAELGLTDSYGKLSDVPDRYAITADELKQVRDNPEEYPLRAVILKAGERIAKSNKTSFPAEFRVDNFNEAKKAVRKVQKDVAFHIVELEERLDELQALERIAAKEPHPRWQVHYEFLTAYLQMELAKSHEYNLALGNVVTETIDEHIFDDGKNCLRLVAVDQLKCRKQFRDMAKEGRVRFADLAKSQRGSPWSDLAEKFADQQLGLKWESVKLEK